MSTDAERIAFDSEIISEFGEITPLRFSSVEEADQITKDNKLWLQCRLCPGTTKKSNMGMESSYIKKSLGLYEINVWDRIEHGEADILRVIDQINDLFIGRSINNGKTMISRTNTLPMQEFKGWHGKQITISYVTTEHVNR